jgi:ATP-binding cassette, subfamily B, bacterial PglK
MENKKISSLQKLYTLLSLREKRQFYLILVLSLLTGFAQAVGVFSIFPFLEVALNPALIQENDTFRFFYELFGFTRGLHFFIFLGVIVFLALVFSNGITTLTIYAKTRFIEMRNHSISSRLLEHYLANDYQFYTSRNTSDLVKNIIQETNNLLAFMMSIVDIIVNASILGFILITILIIEFQTSIIAAVLFGGIYVGLTLLFRRIIRQKGQLRNQANQERIRFATEGLNSFKTTKVMGVEDYYIDNYKKHSALFARANAFTAASGAIPRYIIEAIAAGGIVLFVVIEVALGRPIEALAPLVGLFGIAGYRMLPALQAVYYSNNRLNYFRPLLERIYDDVYQAKTYSASVGMQDASTIPFSTAITFQSASFKYDRADAGVLHQISLTIDKNTMVGIVGKTGSGKTTLMDIILGLLFVQEGSMKVDNMPITPQNVKAWQRQIGYVPQEIYLSDDTVRKNIAFGIRDELIDDQRIKDVIQMAALEDLVHRLPQKEQTIVGERGVRLSGGERQRIGIARALYRQPSLLVLDEATSSLDGKTEEEVLQAIRQAAKSITIIMVAHRLNTLIDCDVIHVMNQGQLIDQGTYQELLTNNEDFQAMAKLETLKEQA